MSLRSIDMQIIIISGQARSGKTTLANILAEEGFRRGYIPSIESFAGPIKDIALEEGLDKEDNKEEYRRFCQGYGAEKRLEDSQYFVKLATEKVAEHGKKEIEDIEEGKKFWERLVIFDDGRYPNELRFGKAIDAFLMFVTRGDDLPDKNGSWRAHESEHLSRIVDKEGFESHFDDVFDVYILNDCDSPEDMRKGIKKNMAEWLNAARSPLLAACEDTCGCVICSARRDGRIPDATEVLEYILWRLTGERLTNDQLDDIERDIESGHPPNIDIDIVMRFGDEDEKDEEELEDD